jgi:hypothetical protein
MNMVREECARVIAATAVESWNPAKAAETLVALDSGRRPEARRNLLIP